jgi:hypothetical protein
MRLTIASALFALIALTPLPGSQGGVASLTPAQQAVHDAASIQEPKEREEALRRSISEGLLSHDYATRDQVFAYLSNNSRWIDLRPYGEILLELSRVDDLHRGRWLLDDAELSRSRREERLAIYQEAIRRGEISLRNGSPLDRFGAIEAVALEGLTELRPLLDLHYRELPKELQARTPYDELVESMELRAGAADREDAVKLAAHRVSVMRDEEVKARMDREAGFQTAVLQLADEACVADPFSGQRNAGCADLRGVVRRQLAFAHETVSTEAESPSTRSASSAPAAREGWLARLRARVPEAVPAALRH